MRQLKKILEGVERRLGSRLDGLEARLQRIEARKPDQIGFHTVESTYPIGPIDDGFVLDDQPRAPGGWEGDQG